MAADERTRLLGRISARLRPLAVSAIVLLLVTGLYNFVRINEAGVVVPAYHIAFGIKFLLALHVFGMLFVLSKPPERRPESGRQALATGLGAMISAVIIVALGAYLRTLHL